MRKESGRRKKKKQKKQSLHKRETIIEYLKTKNNEIRKNERETEIETDRQSDRQTDRQTLKYKNER